MVGRLQDLAQFQDEFSGEVGSSPVLMFKQNAGKGTIGIEIERERGAPSSVEAVEVHGKRRDERKVPLVEAYNVACLSHTEKNVILAKVIVHSCSAMNTDAPIPNCEPPIKGTI